MDQVVYEALSQVLDADSNIRMAAELRLKDLILRPEYPISLAKIVNTNECPLVQRQSAVLMLKNYVDTHWSSKNEKFRGPETPEESKQHVRGLIFQGLSDSNNKIRVGSAYVVSKIAHNDWPEQWPNLFDLLLGQLKNGLPEQVHGVMRVLSEFVSNDITDRQFPQIAPLLCPELLRVLVSDNVYPPRTRGRTVAIFRHCIEMLFTMKDELPEATEQFLKPIIPQWTDAFKTILNYRSQGNEETEVWEYNLKLEIVKTLNLEIRSFPKYINPHLMALLEPIWTDLLRLRERFLQEFVYQSGISFDAFQDSDGEVIGFESLLYANFEFLGLAARKKAARSLFMGPNSDGDFLKELAYVVISYMQMTEEQVEVYMSDSNQFIIDEEDESFNYNVRISAEELLLNLLNDFPKQTVDAMSTAIQRHLDESNQIRAAGGQHWWKPQEACLLAIGKISEDLVSYLKDGDSGVKFDLAGLFDHVVLPAMKSTHEPFMQGRAFVFASQFVELLPAELASQYVAAAVHTLQSPEASPPVKVSALKAINNFCRHLETVYVAPYQSTIIESTCSILPTASEDSMVLLLETLLTATKIDQKITAHYEDGITTSLLNVWKQCPADHLIAGIVMDVYEELAKNELINANLSAKSLPVFGAVLTSGTTNMAMVASAIDLITALVKGSPSPLAAIFTEQVFPTLIKMLLNIEDSEALQSGEECLKHFVQKDSEHIIAWRDETGKSGLDYIIQFIAKMLHPSQTESAALFVGDLVIKLIQKAGKYLAPVLPQLLNAATARLEAAQTPTFSQSMVLIFSHLILSDRDTVIDFLSNCTINNKNGLEILMNSWFENYESFQGHYPLKVSAIALSKLFLSTDPRLHSLNVKGDLIIENDKRIVTRSRARVAPEQFTIVSVPVKIVKLLVSDFKNQVEENLETEDDAGDSGDEGEDWEDVDEQSPFAPAEDFAYLSEVIDGLDAFDDEELENDPDLANDPIYQMKLKDYLLDFFRTCAAQNINHFVQIVEQYIDEDERRQLVDSLRQ